jgi:hypothetical protein
MWWQRAAATAATTLLAATLLLCCPSSAAAAKQSSLLRCRCDPRYCAESTCLTDGVCFASAKRSSPGGPVDVVTRCVDSAFLIPPQRPFVCEYNRRRNHTYVIGCCRDGDLCNERLNLTLSPQWPGEGQEFRGPFGERNRHRTEDGATPAEEDGGDEWSWERVVVVVVLGGGSAVSMVLLASLLFRRQRKRHKQQLPPDQLRHHQQHRPDCPGGERRDSGHCRDCCGLLNGYNEVNSCETFPAANPTPFAPQPTTANVPPSASSRASSSGYGSSGRGANTGSGDAGRGRIVHHGGVHSGRPPSASGENISSSLQVSRPDPIRLLEQVRSLMAQFASKH